MENPTTTEGKLLNESFEPLSEISQMDPISSPTTPLITPLTLEIIISPTMQRTAPNSNAAEGISPLISKKVIKICWTNEKEKEKYDKDLIISEKRLKLEEEKIKSEIEFKSKELALKERQIENDEKFKILGLEKEARVRSLKMKYEYNKIKPF